jgi:hypothetical protein
VPDRVRDAFGRLLCDPMLLTHRERVDIARQLSGRLLASADRGERGFGAGLGQWLRAGGDMAAVLGLRPPRGSHRSAQRILAIEHRDRLVVRLVVAVGSQARAARILSGAEAAPAAVVPMVQELQALRAPCSRRAIVDAVRRARE